MTLSFFYKATCLGLALVIYAGLGNAEEADPNFALVSPQVKNICQKVENTPIPTQISENCDAANFYYGFKQPVDFVKARQCAYGAHDYAVLTMIYANGQGVERNWDLAIHFACKAGFAADEIEGRVMHLVQLRDQHWQGKNFDICDDVTSGYMMGVCASYQATLAQTHRQRQLTELTQGWSEIDKKALQHLQNVANAFFTARSANEVDLSGTDRGASQLEEEGALRDDLMSSLKNFANGHLPIYTVSQAVNADQQLNIVYKQIEGNKDFAVGTIDRSGVKRTQILWLNYRDAWIAFGKIKYPQVDADSWKTWLTDKRLKMLQDLAESSNSP